MLQITKQSIKQWLLLDYMAEQQVLAEKIALLSDKYKTTLAAFEAQLDVANEESFEAWDDYIEWKAYHDFLLDINKKIKEVQNGDFQMVG